MGTGRSECPDVAELQHVLGQLVVADDYVAADVEPQVAGRPLEVEWDDESFVAVAVQANDPDAGWVDLYRLAQDPAAVRAAYDAAHAPAEQAATAEHEAGDGYAEREDGEEAAAPAGDEPIVSQVGTVATDGTFVWTAHGADVWLFPDDYLPHLQELKRSTTTIDWGYLLGQWGQELEHVSPATGLGLPQEGMGHITLWAGRVHTWDVAPEE